MKPDIRRDRARQAAQRMIARGERPMYRATFVTTALGHLIVTVDEAPDVTTTVERRRDIEAAVREAIATELGGVPVDSFDIEIRDSA